MPSDLPDYSHLVHDAVAGYWDVRQSQATKSRRRSVLDTGTRAEVTGGRHLGGVWLPVQTSLHPSQPRLAIPGARNHSQETRPGRLRHADADYDTDSATCRSL